MDCLVKFCSDNYQNRLRLLAQARSERYEEAIDIYKELFVAHYNNIMKKCSNATCQNSESCLEIYNYLQKVEVKEINDFFDNLKNVYLRWIDADSINAIKEFENLLKKYNLLKNGITNDISGMYFKGRVTTEILTKFDMFHIPFNKRYLINNQRYSLTGQPLMYIGSSILDIVTELEASGDLENFRVFAIQLPKDISLYDLRSNIYEELNRIEMNIMLGKTTVYHGANFLFRLILSSVCSFQKRKELKGFNFCEEYVISQILAQIIKNNKYDGIIYYSTKRYENVEVKTNILEYKENIALFTKNNNSHVYDYDLYKNLQISVPINMKKIEKINESDIEEVKEEIGKLRNQEKIAKAEKLIVSFMRIYKNLKIDGKDYIKTEQGQLHMYHLFAILNQMLE